MTGRGRPWRDLRGDAGGATVWVLSLSLALLAAGLAAISVGSAVVARHRAGAVADLAALAAAQAQARGESAPCRWALRVAKESSAEILACRVESRSVLVVAQATGGSVAGHAPARARARAGTVETTGQRDSR